MLKEKERDIDRLYEGFHEQELQRLERDIEFQGLQRKAEQWQALAEVGF